MKVSHTSIVCVNECAFVVHLVCVIIWLTLGGALALIVWANGSSVHLCFRQCSHTDLCPDAAQHWSAWSCEFEKWLIWCSDEKKSQHHFNLENIQWFWNVHVCFVENKKNIIWLEVIIGCLLWNYYCYYYMYMIRVSVKGAGTVFLGWILFSELLSTLRGWGGVSVLQLGIKIEIHP